LSYEETWQTLNQNQNHHKEEEHYVVAKLPFLFLILSYDEILAAHGMESLRVQKFVQQSMGGVVVARQAFILFY
jgi:hypothetical protein